MERELKMALMQAQANIDMTISRVPRAVREMTVREFVGHYAADVTHFMQSPTKASVVQGQEWQEFKQEVVSAGLKRTNEGSSSATGTSSEAPAQTKRQKTAASAAKPNARAGKGKGKATKDASASSSMQPPSSPGKGKGPAFPTSVSSG